MKKRLLLCVLLFCVLASVVSAGSYRLYLPCVGRRMMPVKSFDVSKDGIVDRRDTAIVASNWTYAPFSNPYRADLDFDNDGDVDISDCSLVQDNYSTSAGVNVK